VSTSSGLSKLQRRILSAIDEIGAATSADLLERVCGWRPDLSQGWMRDHKGERRSDGGLYLGEVYYRGYPRSPRVALSRALQRLVARGLVAYGVGRVPGMTFEEWVDSHQPTVAHHQHDATGCYTLTAEGRATVDVSPCEGAVNRCAAPARAAVEGERTP
jgi:hypothetical protein